MDWELVVVMALLIAAATAAMPTDITVWLDEVDLSSWKQDVGQVHERTSFSGQPLSIGGKVYERGLGGHANSRLILPLKGKAKRFSALVGVDDGPKDGPGSVVFRVIGDGRVLWQSAVLSTGHPAVSVDVDVTGVRSLVLEASDSGDGIGSDHADWAEARITASVPMPHLYPAGSMARIPASSWASLAEAQSKAGMSVRKVAPGIWRLRLGTPERFTPLAFRSAPPATEALATLPLCDRPPFPVSAIRFRATARGSVVELPMQPGEQTYGFGLNLTTFNATGKRSVIRVSDAPETKQNDSHAPVPFYVSTAGYGVYVDTARYASFYAGNIEHAEQSGTDTGAHAIATSTEELYQARRGPGGTMLVDVPAAKGVDVYLFSGPSMADAIRRYNLFSGGGAVPPIWGLGVHYRGSGGFNAKESLDLAEALRADHMPCDIWGVEPGWQARAYPCSFTWNAERFPDPAGFVRKLHGMGYHMSAWEHAFTHPESPLFAKLRTLCGNFRVWGGLVPDFATPKARKLFGGFHHDHLMSLGVDAFKLDECDNQPLSPEPWSFPECTAFPSGLDGEQMHNLFGVLYQQTLAEPARQDNRRSYGLVRASYAQAAPLPFAIYSDAYDHRGYVRAIAKSGFGGLLWTPEVRDASSIEDLYRRVESVVFSAQTVINCWFMKLPPWKQINKDRSNIGVLMADHEAVTSGIRNLLRLRMSLVPYLYAAFNEYRRCGTPPFRALVVDYPNDPNTWNVDDEYLMGASLLVAPLFAGQERRSVYLPQGDWFDFWTGEKLVGGRQLDVTAPIERIPVYVRSNTLLPLAEPVDRTTPDTCFDITVRIYGDHPASLVLYEDDGETFDYLRGKQNCLTLRYAAGKGAAEKQGGYTGPERYHILRWEPIGR